MGGSSKTTGGSETPNRDAALEELVKSAVVKAVEPVTTGLGELQHRLDPIEAYLAENTIAKHETMLQDRLKPIDDRLSNTQTDILGRIDQRTNPLNNNLNALQNQVLDVDKHVDRLSQSIQSTHDDVRAVGSVQTRLAAETLVRTSQVSSSVLFLKSCPIPSIPPSVHCISLLRAVFDDPMSGSCLMQDVDWDCLVNLKSFPSSVMMQSTGQIR